MPPVGGAAPQAGPPVPGKLRSVSIGKNVGLGLVTLGIYPLVTAFKMTGDLHRMPGGWGPWKTFFWLRLAPLAGFIFGLILYFKNNKQLNALGVPRGVQSSYLPFILTCIPLVSIAAPFVWASQYNEVARRG